MGVRACKSWTCADVHVPSVTFLFSCLRVWCVSDCECESVSVCVLVSISCYVVQKATEVEKSEWKTALRDVLASCAGLKGGAGAGGEAGVGISRTPLPPPPPICAVPSVAHSRHLLTCPICSPLGFLSHVFPHDSRAMLRHRYPLLRAFIPQPPPPSSFTYTRKHTGARVCTRRAGGLLVRGTMKLLAALKHRVVARVQLTRARMQLRDVRDYELIGRFCGLLLFPFTVYVCVGQMQGYSEDQIRDRLVTRKATP